MATAVRGAPVHDRERVCNDTMNTGVTAALVGGFALGNIQTDLTDSATDLDIAIYVANVFAVHACTCSALTSALLYRCVNRMNDDDVEEWAVKNKLILSLPYAKFGMGCFVYLLSVLLLSWRALSPAMPWRAVATGIGAMSMLSCVVVAMVLQLGWDLPRSWRSGKVGVEEPSAGR